jgi:hypothetical protein
MTAVTSIHTILFAEVSIVVFVEGLAIGLGFGGGKGMLGWRSVP